MIGLGLNPVSPEIVCSRVTLCPGQAVDDAALFGELGADESGDGLGHTSFSLLLTNLVLEEVARRYGH